MKLALLGVESQGAGTFSVQDRELFLKSLQVCFLFAKKKGGGSGTRKIWGTNFRVLSQQGRLEKGKLTQSWKRVGKKNMGLLHSTKQ